MKNLLKQNNLSNIDKTATHIEGKSKVGIKTGKEHEEGSDEVVDSRAARIWRYCDTDQIDDSNNSPAQILEWSRDE